MKKHSPPASLSVSLRLTFAALILCAGLLVTAAPPAATVPVNPILPADYLGWTNAFRLQNEQLEAVIVPALGRLVWLAPAGGASPLRMDANLQGRTPTPEEPFFNIGGDWLWPVAQARWPALSENKSDWPPPPVLADGPWQCSAWIDADDAQCARLTRAYGPPLNMVASRLFRLRPQSEELTIHQRLERTAPSDIPVVLWNVSQIANAQQIILPTDPQSRFPKGLKTLMGGKPPRGSVKKCDAAAIYTVRPGAETKLGSDSPRAWIAATKDETLIVETAVTAATGAYPDGGCVVEVYSNSGLGYSEIETLSPEAPLAPGTVLENTLTIRLAPAPAVSTPCDVATAAQALAEQ